MNRETYVRAVLECNFAGFKDEIIETAVRKILEYDNGSRSDGTRMERSDTYSTGHNENETVTSEEEYLTECDKWEFHNKCLTQKLYWKDKNGREHIKTLFECPYEYLCEVTE